MLTVRRTHGSTRAMTDQQELVAALMAELTGRFENLAQLASRQQVASQIDSSTVHEIKTLAAKALMIIDAVQALSLSNSDTVS